MVINAIHETRHELHVECLTTFAALAPFRGEWDAFVERVGSDVYFTFDWLETWWKYYGSDRQLRCFVIRADGRVVATLPFCVQTLWVGLLPVRVAKFVGADSTTVVFSPPIEPGREGEVLVHVLRKLLVDERCDMASLSPLSGVSPLPEAAREICSINAEFRLRRDTDNGIHTIIRLPERIDAFIAALSKGQRSNYRRKLKTLSEI